MLIINLTGKTTRLRVRCVSEEQAVADAREASLKDGQWHAVCRHGGDVSNNYGYPAQTEGVLAVSDPAGVVVCWLVRLSANKVTLGGVASATQTGAREIFDGRCGTTSKAVAWISLKSAHAHAIKTCVDAAQAIG